MEVTEEKRFSSAASVDVNWRVKGENVQRSNVRRSVAKASQGVVTVGGEFNGHTVDGEILKAIYRSFYFPPIFIYHFSVFYSSYQPS